MYYGLGIPSDIICGEREKRVIKHLSEFQILHYMTTSSSLNRFLSKCSNVSLFPDSNLNCDLFLLRVFNSLVYYCGSHGNALTRLPTARCIFG